MLIQQCIAGIDVAQAQFMQRHFPKTEVGDAINYRADRSAIEGVSPDTRAFNTTNLL
jgi:hypothetical protein